MNAGAWNLPTVFLFSDTQIVNETFLDDINNVLNSGEVPNLFEPDEIERIIGKIIVQKMLTAILQQQDRLAPFPGELRWSDDKSITPHGPTPY